MDTNLKLLGENIKKARTLLGISQEELAFRSMLHRTYISSVERGERNISFLNLIKIAKALEISPSELIEGIIC
ncbi:helix-turn-helix domain-containing protein [Escherichia coli]|uniref:helix-turn-helix domain-containing protein n=1 Tax=Escherichia coli TaxID=562 RepID=UPI000C33F7A1|nr:helix-turn-helix transcriptional regulator [Escherichia coli]EEU9228500.1 helix-turn-helix transcriptional regulator [Escherichia coli]EHP6962623.1 helix-turn-helix transcriptional regulator [Escherichia coli]EIA1389478.1 helix-turn-helix transcriptional regulator [Escherichia coli]EIX1606908.1 helix-turn-helix transcriptional regulator [Escherichia coli]MCQ1877460.1 helix-turn-helix domain-containing protein [Escherichia coli]